MLHLRYTSYWHILVRESKCVAEVCLCCIGLVGSVFAKEGRLPDFVSGAFKVSLKAFGEVCKYACVCVHLIC